MQNKTIKLSVLMLSVFKKNVFFAFVRMKIFSKVESKFERRGEHDIFYTFLYRLKQKIRLFWDHI